MLLYHALVPKDLRRELGTAVTRERGRALMQVHANKRVVHMAFSNELIICGTTRAYRDWSKEV
jgi:hypothetical protein